jgi:hypothetical protein
MILALALLAGGEALAQSKFNQTSGAWNNEANWTPSGVPTEATNCQIGSTAAADATATIASSQDCLSKYLLLGNGAGQRGTLDMSGGTLKGAGDLTLGYSASSTGIINQTGGTLSGFTYIGGNGGGIGWGNNSFGSWTMDNSSMCTGLVSYYFYLGNGTGATGELVVAGSSVWSNSSLVVFAIGNGANSLGTLRVNGGTFFSGIPFSVGKSAGAVGRVVVTNGSFTASGANSLGDAAGSTGIVEVSGSGIFSGSTSLTIGSAGRGYGRVTVSNSGKVFNTGSGGVSIGGTNNNSILTVADDGEVRAGGGTTYIGNSAGASGTLTLTNNGLYVCGTGGDMLWVGAGNNSIGWVNVNGGMMSLPGAGRDSRIGYGTGATGIVTITSGVYSNGNTLPYYPSHIGYGANSLGLVNLQGGKLYEGGLMRLGSGAGAVGRVTVTGGTWEQRNDLEIGTSSGGTGLVTVADCVQTNIAGPVKVGGAGYGLVTVSNATFGGTTAMTVTNGGFVELTGTGSVLRCSTFTCRGGSLTNHVRKLAGGLDITGATLVITNGGKVHLSFEEDPVGAGDFWGLRWAGNNRAGQLQAMHDSGALTWDVSALYPTYQGVGIYTNATDTFVGVVVEKIVPRGMVLMVQ